MSVVSPKTAGLVTPRYVVMQVLNRLNDYSLKQYKRLLQICLEGFTELNLFHINAGLEVMYLHMSLAKTVSLPSDYVNWNKIGIPIQGKLLVIPNHENILLPRTFDTGEAVGNSDDETVSSLSSGVFFTPHWKNGAFVGGLYGLPGGVSDAYFRVDKENRQIVFSGSTPRSEVVLEYTSSGLKLDGTSLIPREAVAALRTYVLWQKDEYDPRVAYNAKERLKREHEEAVEAMRSFTNAFSKDEYLAMVYSTSYQAPKR